MALTIDIFPNKYDASSPFEGAYAWLSFLSLDLRGGNGRIVLDVHPSEAAWQGEPVGQVGVALGEKYGDKAFATLDQLMADPEFAAAFNTIGSKLYATAVATVPQFEGATPS